MYYIKKEELSETAQWIADNFENIFIWFWVICLFISFLFIAKLYSNRIR
jgi:hypothetical protein|tara:strand:- start:3046 stop:3192 length:147 start_codon:yes stop_codon:yes gene_type:complete